MPSRIRYRLVKLPEHGPGYLGVNDGASHDREVGPGPDRLVRLAALKAYSGAEDQLPRVDRPSDVLDYLERLGRDDRPVGAPLADLPSETQVHRLFAHLQRVSLLRPRVAHVDEQYHPLPERPGPRYHLGEPLVVACE